VKDVQITSMVLVWRNHLTKIGVGAERIKNDTDITEDDNKMDNSKSRISTISIPERSAYSDESASHALFPLTSLTEFPD
jgi:hypothetical protein